MNEPQSALLALSDRIAALAAMGAARCVAVHGRAALPSSGFIWREGLVVTAMVTLDRLRDLAVTLADGSSVPAELVGRDRGAGLALLRAETGPAGPMPLAEPALGHWVLALGRQGGAPVAAQGIVAHMGQGAGPGLDLRLAPEAEGGPVLDAAGGLVGLALLDEEQRVSALPATTIARLARLLAERGRVARGYLGLALQPVRSAGQPGLMVLGVDPGSPAARAGVMQGDILRRLDGVSLACVRDMLARLEPEDVGRRMTMELMRAGAALRLEAQIEERPGLAG